MRLPHLLALPFLLFTAQAIAAHSSPVGLWKTIDDNSHKPHALVRIVQDNDEYHAYVEKGLDAEDSPLKVCDQCTDARKNQPIVGMTILQGVHRKGDDFEGGEILDPENGQVYHCKIKLLDDGNKLEVRGFIGVPLFGRSQIWLREE